MKSENYSKADIIAGRVGRGADGAKRRVRLRGTADAESEANGGSHVHVNGSGSLDVRPSAAIGCREHRWSRPHGGGALGRQIRRAIRTDPWPPCRPVAARARPAVMSSAEGAPYDLKRTICAWHASKRTRRGPKFGHRLSNHVTAQASANVGRPCAFECVPGRPVAVLATESGAMRERGSRVGPNLRRLRLQRGVSIRTSWRPPTSAPRCGWTRAQRPVALAQRHLHVVVPDWGDARADQADDAAMSPRLNAAYASWTTSSVFCAAPTMQHLRRDSTPAGGTAGFGYDRRMRLDAVVAVSRAVAGTAGPAGEGRSPGRSARAACRPTRSRSSSRF